MSIRIKTVKNETAYGPVESLLIEAGNGMAFCIEPERGLDISHLSINGISISYDAPCGVLPPAMLDEEGATFEQFMFFGLLTTCGLENAGPGCGDDKRKYSQHGSLNYLKAENVRAVLGADGTVLTVTGEIEDNKRHMHNFHLERTIRFSEMERSIEVSDTVINNGERDQICIMYHCNFGAPFLKKGDILDIPFTGVRGKNEDAVAELDNLLTVKAPSENNKPHVFYLGFPEEKEHMVSISNPDLKLKAELSFKADTLPVMDLWKSLRPERYVLAFEPANAYPYGRLAQQSRGNASYLEAGEVRTFSIKFQFSDY